MRRPPFLVLATHGRLPSLRLGCPPVTFATCAQKRQPGGDNAGCLSGFWRPLLLMFRLSRQRSFSVLLRHIPIVPEFTPLFLPDIMLIHTLLAAQPLINTHIPSTIDILFSPSLGRPVLISNGGRSLHLLSPPIDFPNIDIRLPSGAPCVQSPRSDSPSVEFRLFAASARSPPRPSNPPQASVFYSIRPIGPRQQVVWIFRSGRCGYISPSIISCV